MLIIVTIVLVVFMFRQGRISDFGSRGTWLVAILTVLVTGLLLRLMSLDLVVLYPILLLFVIQNLLGSIWAFLFGLLSRDLRTGFELSFSTIGTIAYLIGLLNWLEILLLRQPAAVTSDGPQDASFPIQVSLAFLSLMLIGTCCLFFPITSFATRMLRPNSAQGSTKKVVIAAGIGVAILWLDALYMRETASEYRADLTIAHETAFAQQSEIKRIQSRVNDRFRKRLEIIESLIASITGYSPQEQKVVDQVYGARAQLSATLTSEARAKARESLNQALSRWFQMVETSPHLKTNQKFLDLRNDLDEFDVVDQKDYARYKECNRTVEAYNQFIQSFPNNIAAYILGFVPEEMLKVDTLN